MVTTRSVPPLPSNKMPHLILAPQYSQRIFSVSFLMIISVMVSVSHRQYDCTFCAVLVLLTSLNYWRHPVHGPRRDLDMVASTSSLLYQCVRAVTEISWEHQRHLLPYYTTLALGVFSYGMARRYGRIFNDPDTSSKWHCMLHVMGNIGNCFLYSTLGSRVAHQE